MRIKQLILWIAPLILMAGTPPAWSAPPDGGGAEVRFQIYESPGEMVFRVAEEKFCAKYNIKCHGLRIGSGPTGIQALVGGSLEVSFLTTDAAIRAIAGGADVRVVTGMDNRVPFYIVTSSKLDRPNAGASFPKMLQDFKGKRIGVTGRGAGTELLARALFRQAGIGPGDVTYVAVGGPPTAFGSLAAGQVDAAVMVPPISEICDQSPLCDTVLDLPHSKNIKVVKQLDGTSVVALMSRSFINQHRQVMNAFLAATHDAAVWMKDPKNRDEYYKIGEKYLHLKMPHGDDIVRAALQHQIGISDTRISRGSIQAYINLLNKNNLLKTSISVDQVVSDKVSTVK